MWRRRARDGEKRRIPGSARHIPRFLRERSPLNILTAPIIYSLIVPIPLLDLWISAYQRICFPIYGISRGQRSACIVFDRHHLAYLNAIEKGNCMLGSYANGVLAHCARLRGALP